MEAISHVGQDTIPADQYLGPRRFRILARCDRCGQKFSWITTRADGKNRPCPRRRCREEVLLEAAERHAANMERIVAEGKAPGHIGSKSIVRAIDKTADIVMKEYGFTDLPDRLREGDTMLPKIRPDLQAAADSMFSAKPSGLNGAQMQSGYAKAITRAVNSGALAGMSVNPGLINRGRTPGEPVLRRVK